MKKMLSWSLMACAALFVMAGPAMADANVWVAHGIPEAVVDVYVNGEGPVLEGFTYTSIEGPLSLPAGTYQVDIYGTGTGPGSADPVLSGEVSLVDGQNTTLVAHLMAGGGLALTPFGLDLSGLPRFGSRLGVRHAADAPPVDVVASTRLGFRDTEVIFGVSNPAGASTNVAPGSYSAFLALPGSKDPVVGPIDLLLERQKVYYAYAVGSLADGNFQILLQVLEPEDELGNGDDARLRDTIRRLRSRFGNGG